MNVIGLDSLASALNLGIEIRYTLPEGLMTEIMRLMRGLILGCGIKPNILPKMYLILL